MEDAGVAPEAGPPDVTTLDASALDAGGRDAAGTRPDSGPVDAGPGCGFEGRGVPLSIGSELELCLPPVVCTSETCPPGLGDCVDGTCRYRAGYQGLETLPEAWATYYCTLSTGGCHGVTQISFPEVNAQEIARGLAMPICEGSSGTETCVGIAASNPMIVGNSQEARDPATGQFAAAWGLGMTEATGLCYELTGPGGKVVVALTDRCGGYCKCNGSGFQECGPCVSAPDMEPHCACVGTVPGLYSECCGRGCPTTQADCDWCASNNHPHFDLDTGAFQVLCGGEGINGSCRITRVRPIECLPASMQWPPGGGGGGCKTGSFVCSEPAPHQPQVPGTGCCCNWDLEPQTDGTCQ